MSSSFNSYPSYAGQGQQLNFLTTEMFGLEGQNNDQSKPASLINHPRHSPGPLSTPPHSRNPSQPPEHFDDHQMIYDDGSGSQSNSPNSVPTPDNEPFEVDMLDSEAEMRNYYLHQNVAIVSTQIQQEAIPATTSDSYISDQVLQEAWQATIAQNPQYQHHLDMQNTAFQNMTSSISQPYINSQFQSQHYANQPTHRDPWTPQRPQQNLIVPQSGHVMFDPVSDPMDYAPILNYDVNQWTNQWTNQNTDPANLISPSEPQPQPQDMAFFSTAPQAIPRSYVNYQTQHSHNHRPDVRLVMPSPPPVSHTFRSDHQTSPFLEDYSAGSQFPPVSPNSSSMGSSIQQLPPSPIQLGLSPHYSAASPGGSDGNAYSSGQSDSGMMMDSYHSESDAKPSFPLSPIHQDQSPNGNIPDVTFDASPEPELQPQARRQTSVNSKASSRPGGRSLGTHLDPKVAKAAHEMRRTVACWHCVLQRDKCGPGEICERCKKRSQRPNADCGLGCCRIKLIELAEQFLPVLVSHMHEDAHLTTFVTKHIGHWHSAEMTVYLTCGQKHMPRIPVKVYEFVPKGNELLYQIQYVTDKTTGQRRAVQKHSPALGMVHINHNEEKKYDKHVSDIVDNHLEAFGKQCWMGADNDFQMKLFTLMTRVQMKSEDERKLIREVFRLMVVTYIMSVTITMAEETKHQTLSKMRSYTDPSQYVSTFTSPRMANRQLKYFFARIQRAIMTTVLNKLQQIFKSSKGCDKWLAAFIAVTGMCMAHEYQQKTIHQVMATRAKTEGHDVRDMQAKADIACREIDNKMNFILTLFRWKYNRKCNPLKDADHAWDREVGFGDESSVNFVRCVAQLVKENTDFLQARQSVSISSANQTRYTSRLVGQFLLSFWLPS